MSDTKQAEILILDILDAGLREHLGFNGCAFHTAQAAEDFAIGAIVSVYGPGVDFVPEGDYSRPWGQYRAVTDRPDGASRGMVRIRYVRAMDLGK